MSKISKLPDDKEPKLLMITIKKHWFDLIDSKVKGEEYKEIKPHWISRLMHNTDLDNPQFKSFSGVLFANGNHFGNVPKITTPFLGISIGSGRPEWGAEEGKIYFKIKVLDYD